MQSEANTIGLGNRVVVFITFLQYFPLITKRPDVHLCTEHTYTDIVAITKKLHQIVQ